MRPKSSKTRKMHPIYLTDEEHAFLRRCAEYNSVSMSQFIICACDLQQRMANDTLSLYNRHTSASDVVTAIFNIQSDTQEEPSDEEIY